MKKKVLNRFRNNRRITAHNDLTTLKMILKEQKPWSRLSLRERLLFFDLYLPIRILGNAM